MTTFDVLRGDHERVLSLFDRYEVDLGARNFRQKRAVFEEVRAELEAHRLVGEGILYPAALAAGIDGGEDEIEGHRIVARLLEELSGLGVDHPRFDVVFAVLRENVEQHIREEEGKIFPALDRALSGSRRGALRRELAERHESVRPCV